MTTILNWITRVNYSFEGYELGEEARKGSGNLKIGLVISLIVVIVLATSNIWFYLNNNDYVATHSYTNSEYDTLQLTYNNYVANHQHTDSEYNELQQIANLQKYQSITDEELVLQENGERTFVVSFTADYAGYLIISLTSTTSNAYVDIEFDFHAKSFKSTEVLGTSGSATICVLPTTVYIYVGNTNWFDPATHTISVTYWY